MFFRRKPTEPINEALVRALRARTEDQEQRLQLLEAEHAKLQLAFNSFRQRVYAWRKWEPDERRQGINLRGGGPDAPESPESPPPADKPPLDKAAILRAHRSKQ